MDRNQQLEVKAKELGIQLKEWATEQGLLLENEKLVVSVEIKPSPKVEIQLVTHGRERRYKFLQRVLTEADWQIINALPWSIKQKAIIAVFRESGNRPIETRTGPNITFKNSKAEGINTVFRKNGNAYRLATGLERAGWGHPIRIYAIE